MGTFVQVGRVRSALLVEQREFELPVPSDQKSGLLSHWNGFESSSRDGLYCWESSCGAGTVIRHPNVAAEQHHAFRLFKEIGLGLAACAQVVGTDTVGRHRGRALAEGGTVPCVKYRTFASEETGGVAQSEGCKEGPFINRQSVSAEESGEDLGAGQGQPG